MKSTLKETEVFYLKTKIYKVKNMFSSFWVFPHNIYETD